jgi:hypothetical protein
MSGDRGYREVRTYHPHRRLVLYLRVYRYSPSLRVHSSIRTEIPNQRARSLTTKRRCYLLAGILPFGRHILFLDEPGGLTVIAHESNGRLHRTYLMLLGRKTNP